MGKIAKIKWNNINGGIDRTDLYPVTSDRAVYNGDNKTMREIIKVRGVVNISTYFSTDGTAEVLTLDAALKKITEENRCPGFLATILTSEGWWTFRYNEYAIDDTTWYNTDNWVPFHAGQLKTDTTSEDPETPLHLELVVKSYIYTLKGWINAVSATNNGYLTAEDYNKFLQALEDINSLKEEMITALEKINDHESRITNAESRLGQDESRIGSAESKISAIESSIDSINDNIDKLYNELKSEIDTKQDKLTAGTGIEITSDNVLNCTVDNNPFLFVDELPTENINSSKIYCIKDPESTDEKNIWDEYYWIESENRWEMVGKYIPAVDLTPYEKIEDADKEHEALQQAIDGKQDALKYYKEGDNYSILTISTEGMTTEISVAKEGASVETEGKFWYNEKEVATVDDISAATEGKQDVLKYYSEKTPPIDEGEYNAEINAHNVGIIGNESVDIQAGTEMRFSGGGQAVFDGNALFEDEVRFETKPVVGSNEENEPVAVMSDLDSKQNKLTAGTGITIEDDVISSTATGSITDVTATGTSPLTLTATNNDGTVSITGSVDTYSKEQINEMIETATAGGITTVVASGDSHLTLEANTSGTTATITGSIDLSGYATTLDMDKKQDALKYYKEGDNYSLLTIATDEGTTEISVAKEGASVETEGKFWYNEKEVATVDDISEAVENKQDTLEYYIEDTERKTVRIGTTGDDRPDNIVLESADNINIDAYESINLVTTGQAKYNGSEIATKTDISDAVDKKQDALNYYNEDVDSKVVNIGTTGNLPTDIVLESEGDVHINGFDSINLSTTGQAKCNGYDILTTQNIQLVDELPSNPSSNVLYLIPE